MHSEQFQQREAQENGQQRQLVAVSAEAGSFCTNLLMRKGPPWCFQSGPNLIHWSRLPQSIFGSVSNWWYGGGLDRVHSSVVAPSPHGLSGALRPAASDQNRLMKNSPMLATVIM